MAAASAYVCGMAPWQQQKQHGAVSAPGIYSVLAKTRSHIETLLT